MALDIVQSTHQTSRLCVKNLPKNFSKEQLKDTFKQVGQVTDAKIIVSRDGKQRNFGFVGFKTVQEAEKAQNYYNKTFINAQRIIVEFAKDVVDEKLYRNNQKGYNSSYANGPMQRPADITQPKDNVFQSKLTSGHTDQKVDNINSNKEDQNKPTKGKLEYDDLLDEFKQYQDDLEFQEFLQVTQPRLKKATWANDDIQNKEENKSERKRKHEDMQTENDELVNEYQDLNDFEQEQQNTGEQSNQQQNEGNIQNDDSQFQQEDKAIKDLIYDTGRLFVQNLSYETTEEDMMQSFASFGEVTDINILKDRFSKASKGMAFVTYLIPEDAYKAFQQMNFSTFQGRILRIKPAQPHKSENNNTNDENQQEQHGGTYKKQKQKHLKEDAGNRQAWNTLYFRQDTVIEAIAKMFNVTKAQLLDPTNESLAVKVTLGETQILQLTKKELEEQGINIGKLEEAAAYSGKASSQKNIQRSKDTILLKNLPYQADWTELEGMLEKYGSIQQKAFPSTHTLAFVKYESSSQALRAFSGLAFKKFHNVPLYLEFAPLDIFKDDGLAKVNIQSKVDPEKQIDNNTDLPLKKETQQEDVTQQNKSLNTLYVKNLPFSADSTSLRNTFDPKVTQLGGSLKSAVVSTRKGNKDQVLSRGFGFIEVDCYETARKVIQKMQGFIMEGHKLTLALSTQQTQQQNNEQVDKVQKAKSFQQQQTKLLVRNVGFQANKKELKDLFSSFGVVKSVRLPKKFDGKHRGYAFVEYITHQEALNALKTAQGSHLYGRRLIIELAQDEVSLEKIRSRAQNDVVKNQAY